VPKEEIVRVKADRLIYVNTSRPNTKFKQRITRAVKGLSNKTFDCKKPNAENSRALDFNEVHRELDLILRMHNEDEEEQGDNSFITEDDFNQILDNSCSEGLSILPENKNNLQFRLSEEATSAKVQPVNSNIAVPGNVYAKLKFSSVSNGEKIKKKLQINVRYRRH